MSFLNVFRNEFEFIYQLKHEVMSNAIEKFTINDEGSGLKLIQMHLVYLRVI